MVTEVTSKDALESLASKLREEATQLATDCASINGYLSSASDYDGINISAAANAIADNLKSITAEIDSLAASVSSYVAQLKKVDEYDLRLDGDKIGDTTTSTTPPTTSTNPPATTTPPTTSTNPPATTTPPTTSTTPTVPVIPAPAPEPEPEPEPEKPNTQYEQVGPSETVVVSLGDPNYDVGDRYHNYPDAGIEVTVGNRAYKLCDKDFDLICSIVAAEGDQSYDGSLAIISTILNRCEDENLINAFGPDPISQATANGQYASYGLGQHVKYSNGNYSEAVKIAVRDALAGVRNNRYVSITVKTV